MQRVNRMQRGRAIGVVLLTFGILMQQGLVSVHLASKHHVGSGPGGSRSSDDTLHLLIAHPGGSGTAHAAEHDQHQHPAEHASHHGTHHGAHGHGTHEGLNGPHTDGGHQSHPAEDHLGQLQPSTTPPTSSDLGVALLTPATGIGDWIDGPRTLRIAHVELTPRGPPLRATSGPRAPPIVS